MFVRRMTIFEYERGLLYRRGRFQRILEPGQYWYRPSRTTITKVDMRASFIAIAGQEVLSSDGVTLKVTLAAQCEIADPHVAVNKVQSCWQALYMELQLVLRDIVGRIPIEELLANREKFSSQLREQSEQKVAQLGLRLISVSIKDIMFPGPLKELFSQVVRARQEGLAALERARGETAALRNLANGARLMETHPMLAQLRLFQSLGQSSGNTVILGMPQNAMPIPIRALGVEPDKASEAQPGEGDASCPGAQIDR